MLVVKVAHIDLGFDFKVKRWSNRLGWEARDNILQRGGPHLTWYPSSPVVAQGKSRTGLNVAYNMKHKDTPIPTETSNISE